MLRDSIIDDVLHPEILRSPRVLAFETQQQIEGRNSGGEVTVEEKTRLLTTYLAKSYKNV